MHCKSKPECPISSESDFSAGLIHQTAPRWRLFLHLQSGVHSLNLDIGRLGWPSSYYLPHRVVSLETSHLFTMSATLQSCVDEWAELDAEHVQLEVRKNPKLGPKTERKISPGGEFCERRKAGFHCWPSP